MDFGGKELREEKVLEMSFCVNYKRGLTIFVGSIGPLIREDREVAQKKTIGLTAKLVNF